MNAKIEWLEGPAPQTLGAITQLWLLKLTRKTPGSSYDTVVFKYVTTDSLAVVNAEAKKMWDAAAAVGQQVVSVCWESMVTKETGCYQPLPTPPQPLSPSCAAWKAKLASMAGSLENLNAAIVNAAQVGADTTDLLATRAALMQEISLAQANVLQYCGAYTPRIPIGRQPEVFVTTQPYIPPPPMAWQPRLTTVTVNTEFNDGHTPGAIRFLALRGVEWLGAVKDPQACSAAKTALAQQESLLAKYKAELAQLEGAITMQQQIMDGNADAGLPYVDLTEGLKKDKTKKLGQIANTGTYIGVLQTAIADACQELAAPPPICPDVPCSADKDCVDGKCVDKCPPNYTRDVATGLCKLPTPTTGGASGIGPLGVVLLAGAALGAIYLAMRGVGTNLPPQPGRSMKDNPCNCQLP